jgi:two-component system response regulator
MALVKPNPVEILLVEDSPTDRLIAIEALKRAKINNRLHPVIDGVEAMDFLRRNGRFSNAPRPHLILLDLNLPRKDGREVLEEVKKDPDLKMIPVIVLTTSSAEEDIVKCYGLHANCYVTKPMDFSDFIRMVQVFEDFWINIASLPPG